MMSGDLQMVLDRMDLGLDTPLLQAPAVDSRNLFLVLIDAIHEVSSAIDHGE